MESGIELTVIWLDQDVVELRIHACNGRFSGEVFVYTHPAWFDELRTSLAGFPKSHSDCRELDFGLPDPGYAGGTAKLRFTCIDLAAHSVVDVKLNTKGQDRGVEESASLRIPVEPASIDEFCEALAHGKAECGWSIRLRAAGDKNR